MIRIETAGIQTTVQGKPRLGYRHKGVPWAGAADPLSLALANHLVGNRVDQSGVEITLGGFSAHFLTATWIGLAGAVGEARLSGHVIPFHRTIHVQKDDILEVDPPKIGARSYLAVAGGVSGQSILGSSSTYLPAHFGGMAGRALQAGDVVQIVAGHSSIEEKSIPQELCPFLGDDYILRAVPSIEFELLDKQSKVSLFEDVRVVSERGNRIGLQLWGAPLKQEAKGVLPSAMVYPGTVQCPEDGMPFLLSADSQTTGGYPRIAQVIRADRHRIGQLRSGNRIKFIKSSVQEAAVLLIQKVSSLRRLVPDITL